MATPLEAVIRRKYCWRTPSVTPRAPNSTVCSSKLKQEFLLEDWWLIKVDSDSCGKRLGIGGFTSKENNGMRCFSSAPIVKRHDAVTFTTADGITIMINGHLNRPRTLESGFSHEVCDHFVLGFPYYWEEFATVSVEEEPEPPHLSESEMVPVSDEHKVAHASITLGKNIVDDTCRLRNGDRTSIMENGSSRQTKSKLPTPDETHLNHNKAKAKCRKSESNLEDVDHAARVTGASVKLHTNRLTRASVKLHTDRLTRASTKLHTDRLTRASVKLHTDRLTRSRAQLLDK